MTEQEEVLSRKATEIAEWDSHFVPLLESLLDHAKDYAVSLESRGSEEFARGQAHSYRYLLDLRKVIVAEDAQKANRKALEETRKDNVRLDSRPRYVPNS